MLSEKQAEHALEAVALGCDETKDPNAKATATAAASGPFLRTLFGRLRAEGFSFIDILSYLTMILDLISELGPALDDIIKRITDRFKPKPAV